MNCVCLDYLFSLEFFAEINFAVQRQPSFPAYPSNNSVLHTLRAMHLVIMLKIEYLHILYKRNTQTPMTLLILDILDVVVRVI